MSLKVVMMRTAVSLKEDRIPKGKEERVKDQDQKKRYALCVLIP